MGGGTSKLCQNICLLNIYPDQNKNLAPYVKSLKINFWGSIWGVPGGWYPQTMSKYLSVKYLLISKKLAPIA